MRSVPRFRRLRSGKDAIIADEWNALVAMVENMYRSSMTDGIIDSTGFHPRRRPIASSSGIRWAFCKNNAGSGSTIACYLDTNIVGEEITVHCDLITATNLSDCFPTLEIGQRMPVAKEGDTWRSLWWFQGNEAC